MHFNKIKFMEIYSSNNYYYYSFLNIREYKIYFNKNYIITRCFSTHKRYSIHPSINTFNVSKKNLYYKVKTLH